MSLKSEFIELCKPFLEFCAEQGETGLFLLSLSESIFFPLPPDALLIPMLFQERYANYKIALIAGVGSVLGAIIGYIIGRYFGRRALIWLFRKHARKYLREVDKFFNKFGSISIILAAFTPIPFKVFTLTAGVSQMNFLSFLLCSAIGRFGRFLLVTWVILQFGQELLHHMLQISLIVAVIVMIGLIYYQMTKPKPIKKI
jgi:undecaprenyl-diphosphatase